MMARDPAWTEQLGNAVLTQDAEVMDAVQRMRQRARSYGYLAPNSYINVIATGGDIQILPVDPNVVYVPYYDPLVVFAPPRPGFAIAGAIHFGPGITIGAAFGGWAMVAWLRISPVWRLKITGAPRFNPEVIHAPSGLAPKNDLLVTWPKVGFSDKWPTN
jgi:hypothetical protein